MPGDEAPGSKTKQRWVNCTKYKETTCKTALSKSSLPGLDYSLNPYTGCEHACIYCYAPSTLHYAGSEPWGTFVQAKMNIPVVLEKESRKLKPGVVGISTVTDPYQPVEKKLQLTRRCLEVLLAKSFPICIQTKSALVTRDIDLISQFAQKEVGFTITTLDDRISSVIEPGASVASERLAAMKELSDSGVTTWAFVGPVIPGVVTVENCADIVQAIKDAGASRILIDPLRLKPGMREAMLDPLKQLSAITGFDCEFISSDGRTYDLIKEKTVRLCAELHLPCEPGL